MKEFKNGLSEELKLYVKERRTESTHELAILADEYTLTYKKGKTIQIMWLQQEDRTLTMKRMRIHQVGACRRKATIS